MLWIMVDVEADGPQVAKHSMISFGAVVCKDDREAFYGECRPIGDHWVPEALAVSGFTREQTLDFERPAVTMVNFVAWLGKMKERFGEDRVGFISDNNGFDWQWINWYLLEYTGSNPFGYSSTNLGSLYKGILKNPRASFKRLRTGRHTHHPVDDARGNVGALQTICRKYNIQGFV